MFATDDTAHHLLKEMPCSLNSKGLRFSCKELSFVIFSWLCLTFFFLLSFLELHQGFQQSLPPLPLDHDWHHRSDKSPPSTRPPKCLLWCHDGLYLQTLHRGSILLPLPVMKSHLCPSHAACILGFLHVYHAYAKLSPYIRLLLLRVRAFTPPLHAAKGLNLVCKMPNELIGCDHWIHKKLSPKNYQIHQFYQILMNWIVQWWIRVESMEN